MQINKISSNSTAPVFGAKLVIRKGMFSPNQTKNIIEKFENKTKNIDGTIYAVGFYTEDAKSIKNANIYYKNNDYQDVVRLNGGGNWTVFNSTDTTVELISKLLDTFKLREKAVNATKTAREEITRLKTGINETFEKMHKEMNKTLDLDLIEKISDKNAFTTTLQENCSFANKEVDGIGGVRPGFNTFDTMKDSFESDCKYANELLNSNNT